MSKTKPIRHVAVNTRLLLKGNLEGIGRFSVEILRRWVEQHPDVRFSFFFDRPYDERYRFGPNVEPHVLFPQARHPFLFIWWFEWSVARKLRQLKPDVFFSPDGYLSLRSGVPQVPVFHDLSFEHFPEDVKKLEAWHYRRYFPRFARKAAQIITVSEYSRQDILKLYKVPEEKVTVAHNGCSGNFFPVGEKEKAATRAAFSNGKPYFHCVSAIQPRKNLDNLIRGFDHFKQATGAPHKLIIVGRKAWNFEKIIHSYRDSAWQEDINFTGYVSDEELNRIYGASEGLCYVPYFEGFGLPLLEAMHCEVPILTSRVSSLPEVAGEAALYVDPYKPEEIGGAMAQLAASQALREKLIHSGNTQKTLFSYDRSAALIWNVMGNLGS